MTRDGFPVLNALLGLVVLSSLLLLPLGFNDAPNPFSFLHIPTVIAQLLFIVAVFMNRECRSRLGTLTETQKLFIAILFVYVVAVSYISPISNALFLAYFWLIHIAFFVALLCFYRAAPIRTADPIWLVLGLAALLHVVAFMIAWVIWPERIRADELPVFENIRFLGYFAAPASVAMAVWFATRCKYDYLALLFFMGSTFYLLYTGSRGGALGSLAGLTTAVLYGSFLGRRVNIGRALILTTVTLLLVLLVEQLPKLPWDSLFEHKVAGQTSSQVMNGRSELWATVVKAIKERWVLGYGPSFVTHIFQFVFDPTELDGMSLSIRNTHNIVLQLLLNWGFLGTVIIIATALAFARNTWTALTQSPSRVMLPIGVLTTMLVHSLVSGVFFYPYSTIIAIIAFAYVESTGCRERAS